MKIKTRFAPSPTGSLHIGSARTAIFCWLAARRHNGRFILRIEDTDQARSTQESLETILNGLAWLGITYDDKPYFQSKRFPQYQAAIEALEKTGHAYRCYCSKDRLEALRETQIRNKQKPKYDLTCRNGEAKNKQGPYVIRFKNPLTGEVEIPDLVRGRVVFQNAQLDDLILQRSDGTPTYNLTVVVDDLDMQITHVIRGEDHLNNTPRQINILKALGAAIPHYAHIPMILGEDGKKLSKRHGAVSVLEYRDAGILPQALVNYLVRLGWSYHDQEIFSVQQLIDCFEIDSVNKSAATFNLEKLLWLNQHYLKTLDVKTLMPEIDYQLSLQGLQSTSQSHLEQVILAQRTRVKTTKELVAKSRYFYESIGPKDYDLKAAKKHLKLDILPALNAFHKKLEKLEARQWHKEALHACLLETAAAFEWKLGKLAQPVRVIVTGNVVSPPLDETLALIGQKSVLNRLQKAQIYLESQL